MTAVPEQALNPAGGRHLILYDGVCGLCNRMNQFILPRDVAGVFNFVSLQSGVGRELVRRFGRDPDVLESFHVIVDYHSEAPRLLSKARAALFVVTVLGAPWSWFRAFAVLSDAVLNRGYDLIARHRYRLFGRYETCLLPAAKHKERFIDV